MNIDEFNKRIEDTKFTLLDIVREADDTVLIKHNSSTGDTLVQKYGFKGDMEDFYFEDKEVALKFYNKTAERLR